MSFTIEGKQCKSCKAYLFDNDDVVFCPICGAPHHRSCYERLGHCALEELHGTPEQYDSEKDVKHTEEEKQAPPVNNNVKVTCGMCGEKYDVEENACPGCHTPNSIKMGGRYIAIDFLGGVPADLDIGEGVTADEAKRFVISNSQRFIPKFAKMKNGSKASFNLLAFFFPCAWALSRKMYKLGALFGAIEVALSMLVLPFRQMLLSNIPEDVARNSSKLAMFLADNIEFFNSPTLYVAFAASVLTIALRLVVGIFGDSFYRKHTIAAVKDIKENSEDIDEDMRSKGGVSLLLLILGLVATEYLPVIIASFAGL